MRRRGRRCSSRSSGCGCRGFSWHLSRGFGLRQCQSSLAFGLPLRHSLVFRLIQRMNLGGAIGAFDFNVFRSEADQVLGAQRGLILPPDKTTANHRHQQQQADDA